MGIKDGKWLRGGLGDILLKVGNIEPDQFYVVFSHLKQSEDLVRQYTKNCTYIEMKGLIGSVPNEVPSDCYYPPMPIPQESLEKTQNLIQEGKTIIGIHPIGSKPSREYDIRTGRPQKLMTPKFIKELVEGLSKEDRQILLFCAPNERDMFEGFNVTLVSEEYIWDCIAVVSRCSLVVAVDSAIKTFSAIQKIPTVVVMGDYEDEVRNKFIEPYKEIFPIRFNNVEDVLEETLEHSLKILEGNDV